MPGGWASIWHARAGAPRAGASVTERSGYAVATFRGPRNLNAAVGRSRGGAGGRIARPSWPVSGLSRVKVLNDRSRSRAEPPRVCGCSRRIALVVSQLKPLHQHGFGDLQLQSLRGGARVDQHAQGDVEQLAGAELRRRTVVVDFQQIGSCLKGSGLGLQGRGLPSGPVIGPTAATSGRRARNSLCRCGGACLRARTWHPADRCNG